LLLVRSRTSQRNTDPTWVANLIGAGLGPLLSGALSDMLRPYLGEESLRYALLSLCPGYLWAAWHVWRASTSVTSDLQSAQSEDALIGIGSHG